MEIRRRTQKERKITIIKGKTEKKLRISEKEIRKNSKRRIEKKSCFGEKIETSEIKRIVY